MNTEERMQQEKDAVIAMKSAQANMSKALSRISTLESALHSAANKLDDASKLVSGYVYNSTKSLSELFREHAENARKNL